MPSLSLLRRNLWIITKHAEKSLGHARQLLLSQDPADIQTALRLLDSILKSVPRWEKAIELKARALLGLRRFRDIVSLFHESVPSLRANLPVVKISAEEMINLLPSHLASLKKTRKVSFSQCFALLSLQRPVWAGCNAKVEREQWKFIVLGQACCQLGMMEDAMILLSNGKKFASAAHRKQSHRFIDDSFLLDGSYAAVDIDMVNRLLGSVKLLLRRRAVALAALDAGLYTEAARHLSKILDGRRGAPQAFVAECYMHRALVHQAANRIVDALADCNRCLALNPNCVEALSTRATIYEIIGCFLNSVEDLVCLKAVYEKLSTSQMHPAHINALPNSDLQSCISFINSRVASISERGNGQSMVDHHRLLGLARGCSRAEVEQAYLLLSLRHRPDKSAHFVDRCELVDDREVEVVKGEARAMGLKLFKLLQKAYTSVMSLMLREEMRNGRYTKACNEAGMLREEMRNRRYTKACNEAGIECSGEGSFSWCWEGDYSADHHEVLNKCAFGVVREVQNIADKDGFSQDKASSCEECPFDEASCAMRFEHRWWNVEEESDEFSQKEAFDKLGHLMDTSLLTQAVTCREVVTGSTISTQGLSAEAWMGSNDWGHSVHALSVT